MRGHIAHQFLKLLRLDHARDLLLENHTVSEAAERVGYASLSHFIREFKRYFGETPRSYMQRLQEFEVSKLHELGAGRGSW